MYSAKKFNLLAQTVKLAIIFMLIAVFAIPTPSSADLANEFALETDYLDVKSPIVLEFDTPIKWNPDEDLYPAAPNESMKNHPGISLIEDDTGELVSISMEIDSDNPYKLIITPDEGEHWKSNRYYTLSITEPIVLDLSDNEVFTHESYGFGTYSLSFTELMFAEIEADHPDSDDTKTKVEELIEDFSPRNIKVTAPLRYIKEVEVIHKVEEVTDDTTISSSITNVDTIIDTKGIENGEIDRIVVNVFKPGETADDAATLIDTKSFETLSADNKLYDVGFTKLPDHEKYDVEVILYGENDYELEKRVVQVPVNKDKPVVNKKRFSSAGKSYSLYDLMEKPKNLQTLLEQNSMDELKVQVVHP